MIYSKLAHFSLVLSADGAVRGVVRFASPERAQAAAKALGYGKVRAAQLSVGGHLLSALFKALPGEDAEQLLYAMYNYEDTLAEKVGDTVDQAAREEAIRELTRIYEEELRRLGA